LVEIAQLAYERNKTDGWRESEEALAQFEEMAHRGRTLTGIRRVLEAAKQGRVAKLILAEGTEFKSDSATHQDLINSAAVLTIVNGGQVSVLPENRMTKVGPAAAVLRY
jgi:stalled ribosome rescue protein Dom34